MTSAPAHHAPAPPTGPTQAAKRPVVDAPAAANPTAYAAHWEAEWRAGVDPGTKWDLTRTERWLERVAAPYAPTKPAPGSSNADSAPRALVPGCGRGYAVSTLAALGFRALGVDLSPAAVAAARAANPRTDATGDRVEFAAGDFFRRESYDAHPDRGFALVFDSTFLCALPPATRRDWARTMAAHLAPQRGILIMNVFPVFSKLDAIAPVRDDGPFHAGPPFRLSLSHVHDLLRPVGFELVRCEPVPESQLERARQLTVDGVSYDAEENIMVWRFVGVPPPLPA